MKLASIKNHTFIICFLIGLALICIVMSPETVISSDFIIVLKNGKKIMVDDHWQVEDKIHFEIDEKEISICKNKIENIIDTEKYSYNESSNGVLNTNSTNYGLTKYESNGGVLILKSGKIYKVQKSWVNGEKLFILSNNKLTNISLEEIQKFSKFKKFFEKDQIDLTKARRYPQSKLKNEKQFDEDQTTILIREKIEETKKICSEMKQNLNEINNRYESYNLRQKSYYRNQYNDEHMHLVLQIRSCRNHVYSLKNKLDIWRDRFYEEHIHDLKSKKWREKFTDNINPTTRLSFHN